MAVFKLCHSCWCVLAKMWHFFHSGARDNLMIAIQNTCPTSFLNPLHSKIQAGHFFTNHIKFQTVRTALQMKGTAKLPDLDWSQKNYARWWITIMADKGEWWMYLDKTEWIIYSFALGNCLKNKQEIVGLPQPNPFITKTGN